MANQIPLSGASNAAGAYLLSPEQGEILTNGILQESGAIALAGDKRATNSRQTQFGIWKGAPTAGFVGEGAAKPVTGAEFGQTTINAKKAASILLFTDEMLEDVKGGDLNVLTDSGVRSALADVVDANAVGKDSGTNISTAFDNALRTSAATPIELGTTADALEIAISAALGQLEANGYGNPSNQGILLGFGFAQKIRDARAAVETTTRVYDSSRDPFFGRQVEYSTNLNTASESAGAGKIVGYVVHKPNIHVRVRKDIEVAVSTEATVNDGSTDRNLFQENLTAVRYETRVAHMIHDIDRAVIPIANAS